MLTQIKKIKSFGVFDNYVTAADLPAFGRYNIVYGENGSGKTTLSRLFACLEAGGHPDHPDLEFAVESQSGQLTNGKKYPRKVRVFNSDYVEANIGRFDGPFRHILILGQENMALAEELNAEIITRDARFKRIEGHDAAIAKLEADKGKVFSQIAKTIGEATSGSTLRSYRKPDAEVAFAKLTDTKSLLEDELESHRATVRQEQMASIGLLNVPGVPTGSGEGMVSALELAAGAAARAKKLTTRSAQSAVIERLAQNPDIAAWVEEGVHIHASQVSERCEFCDRPMPADRLKALADHFSVEDQKLKEEIETERRALRKIIDAFDRFALPDRLAFYSELRTEYDTTADLFKNELASLAARLEAVDKTLAEKLALRTTAYESDINSETGPFEAALNGISAVTKRHDDKTASFDKEKRSARDAIESHYLLSIKEQIPVCQ